MKKINESTYGISTYETIPHVIKPLNETLFNLYGNEFQFKDSIKDCITYNKYQKNLEFENFIVLLPDKSDWVAYFTYDPYNQIIYNFEVNPKFRGLGVGKYIINKYPIKYLYVLKNNIPAINLYKKCGFKMIPHIQVYSDINKKPDNVLMYNTNLVKGLFRQDEKGYLYSNISVPKTLKLVFTKAFVHDLNNDKIYRKTPFFKYILHDCKNPSLKIAETYNEKQNSSDKKIYIIMSDIDTETPLTLNYDKLIKTKKGDFILHENERVKTRKKQKEKIYSVQNKKDKVILNFDYQKAKEKTKQGLLKIQNKIRELASKFPIKIQKSQNKISVIIDKQKFKKLKQKTQYKYEEIVNYIKNQIKIITKNEKYHFSQNLRKFLEKQLFQRYKFDKINMQKMLNIYQKIHIYGKILNFLRRIRNKTIQDVGVNGDRMKKLIDNLEKNYMNKIKKFGDEIRQIKIQNSQKMKNVRIKNQRTNNKKGKK